jgi:hypothetical protein
MAFIDSAPTAYDIARPAEISIAGPAQAPREARQEAGAFSPLEWSVVAEARRDSVLSLERPGRISIAMGRIFGGHRDIARPEPRLEALRRISVFAWYRGYALPTWEVARFKAAGFSDLQVETLLRSIAIGRAARRPMRAA